MEALESLVLHHTGPRRIWQGVKQALYVVRETDDAQAKCVLCKHEELSSDLQNAHNKKSFDIVAHVYNSGAGVRGKLDGNRNISGAC